MAVTFLTPDPEAFGITLGDLRKSPYRELHQQFTASFRSTGTRAGGRIVWPTRTYYELKRRGHDVELDVTYRPGCLNIGHGSYLRRLDREGVEAPSDAVVVSIDGDKPRYLFAHANIAQAPKPDGWWAPYWPQAGIIPRSQDRGLKVESIAYFGNVHAGDRRLHSRIEQICVDHGLRYRTVSPDHWHDYSDVDVALALRHDWRFRAGRKPASKYVNALIANVPFIATPESAYLDIPVPSSLLGRATSARDALTLITALRNDPVRQRILRTQYDRLTEEHFITYAATHWERVIAALKCQSAQRTARTLIHDSNRRARVQETYDFLDNKPRNAGGRISARVTTFVRS